MHIGPHWSNFLPHIVIPFLSNIRYVNSSRRNLWVKCCSHISIAMSTWNKGGGGNPYIVLLCSQIKVSENDLMPSPHVSAIADLTWSFACIYRAKNFQTGRNVGHSNFFSNSPVSTNSFWTGTCRCTNLLQLFRRNGKWNLGICKESRIMDITIVSFLIDSPSMWVIFIGWVRLSSLTTHRWCRVQIQKNQ